VCSAPGISPVFIFSIAASSNDRLRNIRRYISADVSGATSMTISPGAGLHDDAITDGCRLQ
jgi:hypothetical protein